MRHAAADVCMSDGDCHLERPMAHKLALQMATTLAWLTMATFQEHLPQLEEGSRCATG